MATFTKKNWVTGETITDTKLNNEKGYYLLEVDLDDDMNGFELQVGTLTEDDLLNVIIYGNNNNSYYRAISWNYNILEKIYTFKNIEYYPSTGILKSQNYNDEPEL